jgi:hypothetical protein
VHQKLLSRQKRSKLSLEEQVHMINFAAKHPSMGYRALAREFKCTHRTVKRTITDDKEKILTKAARHSKLTMVDG